MNPAPDLSGLLERNRDRLGELLPMLRRAVTLDAKVLARLRVGGELAAVFVRLPFDVLVSRSIAISATEETIDLSLSAQDVLGWFDGEHPGPIPARDTEWRAGLPPSSGWRRIETIADEVIRGLVRSGALAVKDAAAREGVPGAQPRAEVSDALLDSVVLSVAEDDGPGRADLTLRSLSALTRMGFLRRDSTAGIDLCGRWTRVAADYGSVLVERPGLGLGMAISAKM